MSTGLRIGLAYDLREDYLEQGYSIEATAEYDTHDSIAAMVASLKRLGHSVDKIGSGKQLARRLVQGEKWDLVFPMTEGIEGRNREAQVPSLLEMFDQPYMLSDPLTMSVSLDKSVAKILVKESGVPTTDFSLINIENFDTVEWNRYPAFLKPAWDGTSKGITEASKVNNAISLKKLAEELLSHNNQPVLVEPYLPGKEFTVGIVGNGSAAAVIGVAEITMGPEADQIAFTLKNKENQDVLCNFSRATGKEAELASKYALTAFHALGCRDICRIDFRSDSDGIPQFMEANPIAGLHPTGSDLPVLAALHGVNYDTLMGMIVTAAAERYQSNNHTASQLK